MTVSGAKPPVGVVVTASTTSSSSSLSTQSARAKGRDRASANSPNRAEEKVVKTEAAVEKVAADTLVPKESVPAPDKLPPDMVAAKILLKEEKPAPKPESSGSRPQPVVPKNDESINPEIINSNVFYMKISNADQKVLDSEMLQTVSDTNGLAKRVDSLFENLPHKKKVEEKEEAYKTELKLLETQQGLVTELEKKKNLRIQLLERALKAFRRTTAELEATWARIEYQKNQLQTNLRYIQGLAKYTETDVEKVADLNETPSPTKDQVISLMLKLSALKDEVVVTYDGLSKIAIEDKVNSYSEIDKKNLNQQTAQVLYKHYLARFELLENDEIEPIKKRIERRIERLNKKIANYTNQLTTSENEKIKTTLENIKAAKREIAMLNNACYWMNTRKTEISTNLGYIKTYCNAKSDLKAELMEDSELIDLPSEEVRTARELLQNLTKLKELTVRTYEVMNNNRAEYGIYEFKVTRFSVPSDLKLAKETFVSLNKEALKILDKLDEAEKKKKALIEELNRKEESNPGRVTLHSDQIATMKKNWVIIKTGLKTAEDRLEQCRQLKDAQHQPSIFSRLNPFNLLGSSPAKTSSSDNVANVAAVPAPAPKKEEKKEEAAAKV